ncbi:MAG: oxygenase MpaB family protein [Algoriphagus sp.]|uniref:oxygenase MpaB family protein n=1 Tax=Algoriphagus sp. TaxID=1872435 RepID=UPI00272298EC|nr:oxygenase MpaB family protein [Algoriphagus sp.]MDO8967788.1 oxygenase MpaB family protein [Algoriphagus sp.]MDP3201245.1 oxygenase MpaB family protein [Algoriphagus sp.]
MSKLHLYTNSLFDDLRQQQDELADRAISALIQNPDWVKTINSWERIPDKLSQDFSKEVTDFFEFYRRTDSSAVKAILERGQQFFEKNGDLYTAMLGFYSLPYCYAFADGAEVLVRSKRIIDAIGERLGETGYFVMEIFRPGAFISDDRAYLVCAKVRLIHAFSRYFIKHYAKDWQSTYGMPVNQEDMIGTNIAFSQIVLRGLFKLGISIDEAEHQAVLAYWKWIGELIGIEVNYWPETSKEAFELDKLIRSRNIRASAAGQKLIGALLSYYRKAVPDAALASQVEGIVSFFLGKEASKALNLKSEISIQGDLLGLFFKLNGLKNFGAKKSYTTLKRALDQQQIQQFGKLMTIQLPVISRS